jgi:hypothetical protein
MEDIFPEPDTFVVVPINVSTTRPESRLSKCHSSEKTVSNAFLNNLTIRCVTTDHSLAEYNHFCFIRTNIIDVCYTRVPDQITGPWVEELHALVEQILWHTVSHARQIYLRAMIAESPAFFHIRASIVLRSSLNYYYSTPTNRLFFTRIISVWLVLYKNPQTQCMLDWCMPLNCRMPHTHTHVACFQARMSVGVTTFASYQSKTSMPALYPVNHTLVSCASEHNSREQLSKNELYCVQTMSPTLVGWMTSHSVLEVEEEWREAYSKQVHNAPVPRTRFRIKPMCVSNIRTGTVRRLCQTVAQDMIDVYMHSVSDEPLSAHGGAWCVELAQMAHAFVSPTYKKKYIPWKRSVECRMKCTIDTIQACVAHRILPVDVAFLEHVYHTLFVCDANAGAHLPIWKGFFTFLCATHRSLPPTLKDHMNGWLAKHA